VAVSNNFSIRFLLFYSEVFLAMAGFDPIDSDSSVDDMMLPTAVDDILLRSLVMFLCAGFIYAQLFFFIFCEQILNG